MSRVENIVVENARIMFRHFSGKSDDLRYDGQRTFCLIIDDAEYAHQLKAEGWNVRIYTPKNAEDEPFHYLPVALRFDILPPKVFMVTSRNKLQLDEESIGELDYAEIRGIDLTVRPRIYTDDRTGEERIKAYLKTMYVTIEEDEFAEKYS